MNKSVLKWAGIGAVVTGYVVLFFSGVGELAVASVVGVVFVLAGIVASLFK